MADIIDKVQEFTTDLLTSKLDQDYIYHNLSHTERVVKEVGKFLEYYNLENNEMEILLLAAWLHDTGFIQGSINHEENSCIIAREFLTKNHFDSAGINEVCTCIMATKRLEEPKSLSEEILRDADCSHFGKKSYLEISELLREELSLLGIASYSPDEWREENIKLFRSEHRFYTDYAQEKWQGGKEKNLIRLMKARNQEKILAKKEALKSKFKEESPARGIQTMYRVTMSNHLKLSDIADTKANILLSVNAIMISLVLSNFIPILNSSSNGYLIYPTVIFVLFGIVSMVLSVLATLPNVTRGKFTKDDVDNKKVNLLFFGNFHQMNLEEYEWAMNQLILDKDYIYKTLTKDLYFLGKVLNRKYKILRWTYTLFIIGMVLSVVAFAIAFRLSSI